MVMFFSDKRALAFKGVGRSGQAGSSACFLSKAILGAFLVS